MKGIGSMMALEFLHWSGWWKISILSIFIALSAIIHYIINFALKSILSVPKSWHLDIFKQKSLICWVMYKNTRCIWAISVPHTRNIVNKDSTNKRMRRTDMTLYALGDHHPEVSGRSLPELQESPMLMSALCITYSSWSIPTSLKFRGSSWARCTVIKIITWRKLFHTYLNILQISKHLQLKIVIFSGSVSFHL